MSKHEDIKIVFDKEKLEAHLKQQEEMDKQIFEQLKSAFPILFEGDEEAEQTLDNPPDSD